ncbi:MAG: carboxylesterase/lipase family protein [Acidimicrobiales bacterium]
MTTISGTVVGDRETDDLCVFKGIPYAAPPIGLLRLRAPRPVVPWRGDLDATSFAPMSIQPPPDPYTSVPGDPTDQSEDCLYLNVFSPDVTGNGGGLPVMVWIHGGGYVSGSATSSLYAGDRLAQQGVVLVTVNYRLGALGWLAHPSLADPDMPEAGFGNWGLQDQIAALEWVRSNIASFGGDPQRVTVFGESAGAMSVAALLATSAPRRLFRRAILQSGAALALGEETGRRVAEELAAALGLAEVSRDALSELPASEILRAQMATSARYEILGLPFQPVIDGRVLPSHPAAAIAAGSAEGIDLLVGTNKDEWRFWTWSTPSLREMDGARLERLVGRLIEGVGLTGSLDPSATIDTYRLALQSRDESSAPSDIYSAISSDWTFRVPAMRLAATCEEGSSRAFAYLFDWASPFGGGVLGACHALDLPFVFGSCSNQFVAIFSGGGEEAEQLSEKMRAAWASFAATGSPECLEVGEWPAYDTERRATKRLGRVSEVIDAPMELERRWLDEAFGPYGEIETRSSTETMMQERAT